MTEIPAEQVPEQTPDQSGARPDDPTNPPADPNFPTPPVDGVGGDPAPVESANEPPVDDAPDGLAPAEEEAEPEPEEGASFAYSPKGHVR